MNPAAEAITGWAQAEAIVRMSRATAHAVLSGNAPKGDVIACARIAGIMAAKRTGELIPLCHPIGLAQVDVQIELADSGEARVLAQASVTARTGVEMEAMCAASVAALTLYDMVKGMERGVTIEQVRLLSKSGGQSGEWRA